MKAGTTFKVKSKEFFENIAKTVYPKGTTMYDKFVKEHIKYAGCTLTIESKVGFQYAVKENSLLWDTSKMCDLYHEVN